ncbi:hypothetical protein [Pontibacter rugosus]|uniref:Uncharacterized protein n=1 Tax=Pontibacter rugosus TaxID=1745966 RepID=A0ABW3SMA5_9BACT
MKKYFILTCLATFAVLAAVIGYQPEKRSIAEPAVTKPVSNKSLTLEEQLTELWDATAESLVVVRALPYYLLLDSEDRETNEDTPKITSEDVIDFLKAVL